MIPYMIPSIDFSSDSSTDSSFASRSEQLAKGQFASLIANLTLAEKVGQLFLSCIYSKQSELTLEAKQLIEKSKLGNVLYFNWANDLNCPQQVKNLSQKIQSCMHRSIGLPALIAIDQEGGRVARLKAPFTHFASNRQMAAAHSQNPDFVYRAALAMGKEMRSVGVNWNLAPIVDIDSNPKNPVIGDRSFATTAEQVTYFAKKALEGYHQAKILTTLKHFPGHGDTALDSHHGQVTIDRSLEQLRTAELNPFQVLQSQTEAIMTAHIHLPQVDPDHCATLSPLILKHVLRQEIGFKGVIISDSLVMRGVAPKQRSLQEAIDSVSKAAVLAFQAGCDCLILSQLDYREFAAVKKVEEHYALATKVMENFQAAVAKGEIAEAEIDSALMRLLALKRQVLAAREEKLDLSVVGCIEHRQLSDSLAYRV